MDDFALKNTFNKTTHYTEENANAAIRGERVPPCVCHPALRLCLVRGIRYSPGFATELQCKYDRQGLFTRAINARRIMSNEIPEMTNGRDTPYCIWYPETATEDSYRRLVSRYPHLKYHVGRACAVAGYMDLYKELDLLPDVHIAEEARDNNRMAIFDLIMASPIRYSVMNDYTRSVDLQHPTVCYVCGLNSDTAVRSFLEQKQKHAKSQDNGVFFPLHFGYRSHYWNITEDLNIGEFTSEKPPPEDVSRFLYTPLPADLPPMNKDLLILMAAWSGDIDRYARLRRPVMIEEEFECVIRGVYHNTFFAKWWSLQEPLSGRWQNTALQSAITARFIMSNDLSRIPAQSSTSIPRPRNPHTQASDSTLPFCIWYPNLAEPETYRELARREPRMITSMARACMIANYQAIYQKLDFKPTRALLFEAEQRPEEFYTEDLNRRAELHGGIVETEEVYPRETWFRQTRH
ncbi:hypothetical protein BO94DRAFT_570357 [Aspergillus sclerotioniger CBS 115572]|uniref:Uncharacterized protein n=1 Tax=Aspergillus sclerotioniger CBS 115572 TaxID=1450535 RepID=A0A317UU98_9EURO|nr:hypothetical protein BO94DRAFT_570357 [Aspergillus sclerotioniger CBS 115572]PWY65623.1 hypothetical protein BO94DRAFT_570357 [Aspergillus sclerotioniger CBS 115572]